VEAQRLLSFTEAIHRNYCTKCGKFYDLDYIIKSEGIPVCSDDGGIIKPDVVLYEEQLDEKIIDTTFGYIRQQTQ